MSVSSCRHSVIGNPAYLQGCGGVREITGNLPRSTTVKQPLNVRSVRSVRPFGPSVRSVRPFGMSVRASLPVRPVGPFGLSVRPFRLSVLSFRYLHGRTICRRLFPAQFDPVDLLGQVSYGFII